MLSAPVLIDVCRDHSHHHPRTDEIVELVFTECVYKMGHCLNNTLQAGRGSEELEYPMESARETSPTLSDD